MTGSVFARVCKPCATSRTSARVNSMKISPIKEMELLAGEMKDVVSLGQGTPSFPTPSHIGEFVKQKVSEGATDKYSLGPGIPALRQAVAAKLLARNGIEADPLQEVLITVGASEALAITVLAVVDPGDEVLVMSPSYSPHPEQIRLAGGVPVYVPLREEANWELDVDAFHSAVSPRTKAVIVATPVNPTGSIISRSALTAIAEIALQNQLYLIADETYEDFVFDDHKHFSIGSIPELRDLAISIYSFSKSYALTGWRCGYVHSQAGIINQLMKIHDAVCICAPLTSQYAGLAALTGPQDCIRQFRHELLLRRRLIVDCLGILPRFKFVWPQGAYYILARIAGEDDSVNYCLRLLHDAKVVLVPGTAFGPAAHNHVRISFCMSESVIKQAFDRLQQFEKGQAKSDRMMIANPS